MLDKKEKLTGEAIKCKGNKSNFRMTIITLNE